MSMQHHDGELGIFDYDDEIFKLCPGSSCDILHYIGKETDGSKIHIPEGIINCYHMFWGCGSIETPPVIPDSVNGCNWMFSNCESLKMPSVIPDGVKECSHMFHGCKSLKTAPVIPNTVKDCSYMFSRCESLKTPSVIPNGVEDCHCMFDGCKSLEVAPIIPDSVKDYIYMFDECSDEIQKAGEWNLKHGGQSYEDVLDEIIKKYGLSDVSKKFDLSMKMGIADLDDKCKNSKSVYMQIINDIKDSFITDSESLKREIEAMDACVEQMKIDNRKKQVSSEFGNIEQTDNPEQQAKNIGE